MNDTFYHEWGTKFDFKSGMIHLSKGMFAVANTGSGNGAFRGLDKKLYEVAGNSIGIVPKSLWDTDISETIAKGYGQVFVPKQGLSFSVEAGVFTVIVDGGEPILVDTNQKPSRTRPKLSYSEKNAPRWDDEIEGSHTVRDN